MVMNKKGSMGVWIFFGFIFLIVIVITILIITNQNPSNKNNDSEVKNNMDVYLIVKDSKYQTFLQGEYTILINSTYFQGDILKDTLNKVPEKIQNNYTEILCKADGFYSTKIEHNFTGTEKNQNSSKITCYLNQIGTLQIQSTGKLEEGISDIKLSLLSKGYYQNIKICTAWSSGIINVETEYNETNIPKRYKGLVDKCFDINESLKDDLITIPFEIKSEGLNKLDFVTFYIFDEELHYDGNKIDYYSQTESKIIGSSEDYIYVLKYENLN